MRLDKFSVAFLILLRVNHVINFFCSLLINISAIFQKEIRVIVNMHFTIHYIFIGSYFVRNINNCFFHILLGFISSDYWNKQFNGFINCHNDFQSSQPNNVLNVRKQYTSGYATTNLGTLSLSLDSQYLAYLLPMNCNTYMTENQMKTQLFGKVCWDFDSRKQAQVFKKYVANVYDVSRSE